MKSPVSRLLETSHTSHCYGNLTVLLLKHRYCYVSAYEAMKQTDFLTCHDEGQPKGFVMLRPTSFLFSRTLKHMLNFKSHCMNWPRARRELKHPSAHSKQAHI